MGAVVIASPPSYLPTLWQGARGAVWVVGAFPCCSNLEGVCNGNMGDAERIAGILLFVKGGQTFGYGWMGLGKGIGGVGGWQRGVGGARLVVGSKGI